MTDAHRVTKLMSLTPTEFAASASRLLERHVASGERVEQALGNGRVTIACEPRPGVRLGGLLDLPRAEVTLMFDGVSAEDRLAFLKRFDLAFQRGGG
jgi:hypothetical protein